MTAGLLYVTMQPRPGLPPSQFHDWYNNEHGPLRLRLPFFPNGYRYRAIDATADSPYDASKHEWLALYDITDSSEFLRPPYTTMREDSVKTEREKETMAQITVGRRMFDLIKEWKAEDYKPVEDIDHESKGYLLIPVCFRVKPGTEHKIDEWYDNEHISLLQKVPGWRRSRRFVTSSVLNPSAEEKEYLAIHEYANAAGQDGPEMKAAVSTEMSKDIYANVVIDRVRRVYEWYYTFGPAPRDIQSLGDPTYKATFSSRDGLTKTASASATSNNRGFVESYITTPDGVQLPYRLEGSRDPEAPLIVLVNSILTDWGIWDEFLDSFFSEPKNQKYRVVRYRARGRYADPGDQTAITVDVLSKDIITILDALRVPQAAAVIGVSLGGATTLNTALQYPSRIASFIACDTNSLAPPSNPTAWGERITLSETDPGSPTNSAGERVVGEKLAEITVRRWFVPESYDGGARQARVEKVKQYVHDNHLEGFKKCVKALYAYDLREAMKTGTVRGLFAVGSGDGVLPQGMKKMAEDYGVSGTQLAVIEGAGHLPMAEQPEKFAKVVGDFL